MRQKSAQARPLHHHAFFGGFACGVQQGFVVLRGGQAHQFMKIRHFLFHGGRFLAFGIHGVEIHHVGPSETGCFIVHSLHRVGVCQHHAPGNVYRFRILHGTLPAIAQQREHGGILFEGAHRQTQARQHETVAPQAAGRVPHGRVRAQVHRFGNQLATAFQPPVSGCVAVKIHRHHAFFARLAQLQAVFAETQEHAVLRPFGQWGGGQEGGQVIGQGVVGINLHVQAAFIANENHNDTALATPDVLPYTALVAALSHFYFNPL